MALDYFEQQDLSSHIKDMFRKMAVFREQTNIGAATDGTGVPTLALLEINGQHEYGINTKTAGMPMSTVYFVKELLKEEFGKSAHIEVLKHAEADAIITAFNKGLKGNKAVMCVDRKTCGFCEKSLRRLLPLIDLKVLDVWSPDKTGKVTCVHYIPATA